MWEWLNQADGMVVITHCLFGSDTSPRVPSYRPIVFCETQARTRPRQYDRSGIGRSWSCVDQRFAGRLLLARHSAQVAPCLRPREQRRPVSKWSRRHDIHQDAICCITLTVATGICIWRVHPLLGPPIPAARLLLICHCPHETVELATSSCSGKMARSTS